MVAIEVVTADGVLRRVDATHEPELFWALRGGGGSFGVVTALEFRLYPLTEVYAGVLFFPIERTAEVLEAWRQWLPSVPDTVTSVGRVLRFPPVPDLPPFLSGQSYVVVEAACQLTRGRGRRPARPAAGARPGHRHLRDDAGHRARELHMDPPGPVPGRGDGALLGELSAEAVEAFARVAGPEGDTPLLSVELRHLGGALAPGRSYGGAVSGIDAEFAIFAVGVTPTAEAAAIVESAVNGVQYALGPWTTGGVYLNFAERPKTGTVAVRLGRHPSSGCAR